MIQRFLAWSDKHRLGRWVTNLALIGVLLILGVWQYQESNQAERALCALRADHYARKHNAEKYLRDVAIGDRQPVPGISEADVLQGIRNHNRTIHALSGLDCAEEDTE